MKNATELREVLSEVVSDLRNGNLDAHKAKAIVGASNAMLKSAQLELTRAMNFSPNSNVSQFLKGEE